MAKMSQAKALRLAKARFWSTLNGDDSRGYRFRVLTNHGIDEREELGKYQFVEHAHHHVRYLRAAWTLIFMDEPGLTQEGDRIVRESRNVSLSEVLSAAADLWPDNAARPKDWRLLAHIKALHAKSIWDWENKQ